MPNKRFWFWSDEPEQLPSLADLFLNVLVFKLPMLWYLRKNILISLTVKRWAVVSISGRSPDASHVVMFHFLELFILNVSINIYLNVFKFLLFYFLCLWRDEPPLPSLAEVLERSPDAYHVVVLSSDMLLVPPKISSANAANSSVRPKMRLLIPAPQYYLNALNQTVSEHLVGIMFSRYFNGEPKTFVQTLLNLNVVNAEPRCGCWYPRRSTISTFWTRPWVTT